MIKKILRQIKIRLNNKRISLVNTYRINKNLKKIKDLKNKYEGKRCFIIGNGPSLKMEDLEKLKDEICFGTHKVYSFFGKTSWRPTYYCAQDIVTINDSYREISKEINSDKFIGVIPHIKYKKISNAVYVKMQCKEFYPELPQFSDNMLEGFYEGYTVSYMCLQMAIYMGFKEICLLGIDHSYSVDMNPDGTIKKTDKKDYCCDTQSVTTVIPQTFKSTLAYRAARNYADEHGIKIYNATRGGCLEEFERVDFDSLFNK